MSPSGSPDATPQVALCSTTRTPTTQPATAVAPKACPRCGFAVREGNTRMDPKTQKRFNQLTGKLPRVEKYQGHTCAVAGCGRTTRAMSRWCQRHAMQHFRTRNPSGRMPRKGELAPFRALTLHALGAYGLDDHPTTLAAEAYLLKLISRPDSMPGPYAKHWRRLLQGGATGRAMLLRVLTVYGWRYLGYPNAYTDDAVFFCCLGSQFLRTVPLGGPIDRRGRVREPALPGMQAEVVGRMLAEKIGAYALLFWQRVESEDDWRTKQTTTLRETLEQHPL